jgi:Tfp pilus assembly protein PilN
MPSINMIAARRAEKHRLELKTRNLVYGILAEAGLFMVALSFMLVQLVTTQGQVGSLNDKIVKLKPQVKQIQSLQEQTATLQPKLSALGSARNSTLYLYTALQNITCSLSTSTWLANLTTSGDVSGGDATSKVSAPAADPTLSITGSSLNQSDVGLTMLRMNQYPQFEHVTLNLVQQTQTGASTAKAPPTSNVEFQIAIQLHSLAPPKSAAKTPGNNNVQKS